MTTPARTTPQRGMFSRNRILLVVFLLVLAAAGGSGYYLWKKQTASAATASSAVQTATVARGNIKLFASGTGDLIPSAKATFGFSSSGKVVEVLAKVGDIVDAGALLARLDDSAAQKQLMQAQRALTELTSPAAAASAKLAVADAKVNVVGTKATLAYLISPDVLYWEEQVAAAETSLQQAKDAAAANPSTEAEKKVKDAEAILQVCQNHLAQAQLDYWNDYVPDTFLTVVTEGRDQVKKVIPPSDEDIASARANYELAKRQLQEANWYLTAITTGAIPEGATGSNLAAFETAQENLAAAQDSVAATNLYAPIHGTVMSVGFQTGDTAGSGSTITISNLDQPYTLEIFLDPSDWSNIRAGSAVEVTFDLLPDNVYTGKVLSIDPELSSTGGSSYIHAYILLDTQVKTPLPFGTTASVDIIGGEANNVLTVPLEAVHEISAGKYAVFVMVDGKPQLRMVEVGLQDATKAEIKTGLSEGDVVTTGITETK
ncbi:MAG: HlyD family efflux transporter periplasmic adaptor subunit [Anaerolineales bacterium]